MIYTASSDIFELPVEAIVIPVNRVGVAGKGLAKEARERFPVWHRSYVRRCRGDSQMRLLPGMIHAKVDNGVCVISFPTKRHWRDTSALGDIEEGLAALREFLDVGFVKSVAVPALGCGLGGLSWDDVRPMIEWALRDWDGEVTLCEPR